MKDLILYQCRKLLESVGEVSDVQNGLLLADAPEESAHVLISYLSLLGFVPSEQTESNGEKAILLTGEGDVNVSLAYFADGRLLRLTVQEK